MHTKLHRLRLLNHYYLFLLVTVVTLGMMLPLRWSVVEFGIVEPVTRHLIKPDVEGVISEVLVKDGQKVIQGQPLAKINDPGIAVMMAANEAEFERARMHLEYVKKMRRKGYASGAELKDAQVSYNLEQTKMNQIKNYEISSPVAGTFLTTDEFDLRVGDKITPGTIIATVADMSRMRMKVKVHEHNISKVQLGNEVRVYMNAFPSMLYTTLSGRVTKIQPQAQTSTDGINFVVIIDLEDTKLKHGGREFNLIPGMAGSAKIIYEKTSFFNHAIRHSFDTFNHI